MKNKFYQLLGLTSEKHSFSSSQERIQKIKISILCKSLSQILHCSDEYKK